MTRLFGRNIPYQLAVSILLMPCSSAVGDPGRIDEREGDKIAMALTALAWMWDRGQNEIANVVDAATNHILMRRRNTAVGNMGGVRSDR